MNPSGWVMVDEGAARALAAGRSLLPAGLREVQGSFQRGDCILIKDGAGKILGRGLSNYAADEAIALKGRKSGEFEAVLGWRGPDELIHRDDLVMEG